MGDSSLSHTRWNGQYHIFITIGYANEETVKKYIAEQQEESFNIKNP